MGTFQQKPGQFALFKNDRKSSDSSPDYRGDGLDLDGTPIQVAAWLKPTKSGGKFMACNIQRKDREQAEQKPEKKPEKTIPTDMDDDIPF